MAVSRRVKVLAAAAVLFDLGIAGAAPAAPAGPTCHVVTAVSLGFGQVPARALIVRIEPDAGRPQVVPLAPQQPESSAAARERFAGTLARQLLERALARHHGLPRAPLLDVGGFVVAAGSMPAHCPTR